MVVVVSTGAGAVVCVLVTNGAGAVVWCPCHQWRWSGSLVCLSPAVLER